MQNTIHKAWQSQQALGWDAAAHQGHLGHGEAQVTICKSLVDISEGQKDMHTLPEQYLKTKS